MAGANWISSGEPVPLTPLRVADPPCREWRFGRFTFRRSRRAGRWACQVTDRGAAQYRTPFGAWLAVRRMLREG